MAVDSADRTLSGTEFGLAKVIEIVAEVIVGLST